LGGEPFAQAAALAELGKALSYANLGVLTFTGYRVEYLQRAGRQDYLDLLTITDLLIDGPYRADLADYTRPWVGSSNKRYHFLTPRYIGAVDLNGHRAANRIEVRLASDSQVSVNGMADLADLEAMFKGLCVNN
jgi:anaerobic ribonucleoside-triphosphate reductase activating protein